jgi:large repetitive protein
MKLATLSAGLLASILASAQTMAPILSLVSPNSAPAGGPVITISLVGSNFAQNAVAIWNGSTPLATTFSSSSLLTATVPANLIAVPGFASVQVQNPDGTRSGAITFTITGAPVSIVTDTVAAAVARTPYSFTLVATGGAPPYTWTIVAGTLPTGLSLDPTTGTISGTPTTAGAFSFLVRVTDRNQASAQKSLQLTVNPPPFSISTNSPLPTATVGVAYSQTFAASGGVPPYRWLSTPLPPGLSLATDTGVLSGTPTANGSFTFTVQVADSSGLTATKVFTVVVNPPPLVITTDAVFAGTVGVTYSQTFSATGGIPPYQWAVASGSLPSGLTFDASRATITGTPDSTGSFTFQIRVTDSAGTSTTKTFTLTVGVPQLNILTASPLPSGVAGTAYTLRFTAVGGTTPYTWSISAGSVPGLTLDAQTGTLAGAPTLAGSFTFTVAVQDSAGLTTSKSFTLVINPSLLTLVTPRDLEPGVVGTALSQRIEASGGVLPYTWSANGLPDGLSLDPATGILSGEPKLPGTFSFTIRVTDAARTTAVDLYRIVIGVPALPTLNLSGLPTTVDPATQPAVQLSLGSPFPVDLAGQLTLSFVPDSGGGDSTIQFSTGGRTVPFTIAANNTSAVFMQGDRTVIPNLGLQTGTVAGSIRIGVQLMAADLDVTPTPAPTFSARVDRAAPKINRISFIRSSNGLNIQVIGYSTAREVTEAVFRFTAAGNNTLQTPSVTIPVENLFTPWFQDPRSSSFGSQFTFTQQFTVQGDANALTLDSVTLTNRLGSATAKP